MPLSQVYNAEDIKAALDRGEITEADIDSLILPALTVRLKYAFAEDRMDYSPSLLVTSDHVQLAREAAEQSMVLLKNDGVLPLSTATGQTVAVIGRLADEVNTGDRGSSNAKSPYVVTPYQGLLAYHARLGNEVLLDDGTDLERARQLASSADQVVLLAGYTYEDEGEYLVSTENMKESAAAGRLIGEKGVGGDREELSLLASDLALIEALAPANDNLVLVYIGGSAIDMSPWEDEVPAILYAWYAGMEGGNALARVLYGDVNPSGKLPFAVPANSADYPPFTPYTEEITYGYYHGYTLFDKRGSELAYPFGFGLSYTHYSYGDLQVLTPELGDDGTLEVQIEVTNSGRVAGDEIVQLYAGFSQSQVDRPVKLLRGFQKLALAPGETRVASFTLPVSELAWYNPDAGEWQVEAMPYEVFVGGSSAEKDLLRAIFTVQ
jgi:beta-glucosidase